MLEKIFFMLVSSKTWKKICFKKIAQPNFPFSDTDSLIFLNDDSKPDRLADLRADRLGFLTSEIPEGYRITKFVSMAPKVYSYLLENEAGDVKTVCKVKGVVSFNPPLFACFLIVYTAFNNPISDA